MIGKERKKVIEVIPEIDAGVKLHIHLFAYLFFSFFPPLLLLFLVSSGTGRNYFFSSLIVEENFPNSKKFHIQLSSCRELLVIHGCVLYY